MQIASGKETVYRFDHPTKGYSMSLSIFPYASGYAWILDAGEVCVFDVRVDDVGKIIRRRRYEFAAHCGFSCDVDRDGLFLTFNGERVFLE